MVGDGEAEAGVARSTSRLWRKAAKCAEGSKSARPAKTEYVRSSTRRDRRTSIHTTSAAASSCLAASTGVFVESVAQPENEAVPMDGDTLPLALGDDTAAAAATTTTMTLLGDASFFQ